MNYIVMDLEFNQPFDFAKNMKKKANPAIPFEIIQVGCVKLNEKFEKIDELNIIVRPKVYKRIHPFVCKITGITQSVINNGEKFDVAYEKLIAMIDDESVFCVWGDVDLKLLFKNVAYYGLPESKLTTNYINVQKIASKRFSMGRGNLIGLKNAIELLEIETDSPFHDAFNDAVYTSLVLKNMEFDKTSILKFNTDNSQGKQKNIKKDNKTMSEFKTVYNYCEKELGRKLTQKEKRIFKNVYLLGQNNQKDNTLWQIKC